MRRGQLFKIVVHQITNAYGTRPRKPVRVPVPELGAAPRILADAARVESQGMFQWRRVRGSFQISIPVRTKDVILEAEEQLLSIFRWIEQSVPATDRWYRVFERYVQQIAQRVQGLGGDPDLIVPSPTGQWRQPKQPSGEARVGFTGKIAGLIFDRFGDFEGFILDTGDGERRFVSREKEIMELADRVWWQRIRTTVYAECHDPHRPLEIVLREPPAPFGREDRS